jgi:hypothetical protein
VCFLCNGLCIVDTKPVDVFGKAYDLLRTDRNAILAGFAFFFFDYDIAGFSAFRNQHYNLPSARFARKKRQAMFSLANGISYVKKSE